MALESVRCEEVMRATASLATKLESNLVAYATAASAAGVGVLALKPAAEAKVIYTPTHVVIRGHYDLDLNSDGITDFSFSTSSGCSISSCYASLRASGGAVELSASDRYYAAALRRGKKIGPNKLFGGPGRMVKGTASLTSTRVGGPWVNVKNRYLGLRFQVNGEAHYGWARLNVSVFKLRIRATLTGYAYETIPDKAIIAGNRGSTTGAGPSEPASLGRLAVGASGMKRGGPVATGR